VGYQSSWITEEARAFRTAVRDFVEREFVPQQAKWRAQGHCDADAWTKAGALGLLLPDIPMDLGGGGGTFAFEAVVLEELSRAGVHFGANIQSIVAHYILSYGTDAQKRRWLPRIATGELVAAIAMTEPAAGSDLQAMKTTARRDGDRYLVNGSKTFITNGTHAGLVCVALKTDPKATGPRAISLLMVETKDLPGYRVGKPLDKVGRHGHDTCELFFEDVPVSVENLLGAEGQGLKQMMEQLPYERLSVALQAVVTAEAAVTLTARYVKERTVLGKPLFDQQNTRMVLAECRTQTHVSRVFVDQCITQLVLGQLDSATASMAKYFATDSGFRTIDHCVQLHGGYGYSNEYAIARMWADSRVERIFAGSNEVMKELIAWSL
jgi:acyl-CoA dehydrogenase